MINILKGYFELEPEYVYKDKGNVRYVVKDMIYTIITVTNEEQQKLIELYEVSEGLKKNGDSHVATFHRAKDNKFIVTVDNEHYIVLKKDNTKGNQIERIGRKLAKFHVRGRMANKEISTMNQIGKWTTYWEKRLDQMEKLWSNVIRQYPGNNVEKLFTESFPYYMGLTENAIQYIVDAEMDVHPGVMDGGTVCHERFRNELWESNSGIRNPFDWVYDHATRDIAEWIRENYHKNKMTYRPYIERFIADYESITVLSDFSWRMLYGRMLFPLHYFETIEAYFITESEQRRKELEERLEEHLRHVKGHEHFLSDISKIFHNRGLKTVDWLESKTE